MKGFLVSCFSLPCSIVKHSESDGEKREKGDILDKSSMEANSCSTAGEMYLTLFHHIVLFFSTQIESLTFSGGDCKVTCVAGTSSTISSVAYIQHSSELFLIIHTWTE